MKYFNREPHDEEQTVKECMNALTNALSKNCTEKHPNFVGKFDIIIDEKQFTFILGGPQAQGLYLLLNNIAVENGYELEDDEHEESN